MIELGSMVDSELARFALNGQKLVKTRSATNEATIDSLRLQKRINSVAVLLQAINIILMPPYFSMKAWYKNAVQRVRPCHVR